MNDPESTICTVFLFSSLLIAGIVQTVWMKSRFSNRFAIAIDGCRTFRGRRVFGQNKTWRGFIVMVPATGFSFLIVHAIMQWIYADQLRLWKISGIQYFLLGCAAGLGFMLIELPNSFLKRQFDIAPGAPSSSPWIRRICFVVDQIDSIVGGLLAVWIFVSVPATTVICLLLIGAATHYAFNCVLLYLGLRTRAE